MKKIVYFIVIMVAILIWMISMPLMYIVALCSYIIKKIKHKPVNFNYEIYTYVGYGDIVLNKIDNYFKL